MKFVKLSIVALSLGLFVASCGDSTNNETENVDSTATMTTTPEPMAPAMDTTTAMPADTTHMSTDTMAH